MKSRLIHLIPPVAPFVLVGIGLVIPERWSWSVGALGNLPEVVAVALAVVAVVWCRGLLKAESALPAAIVMIPSPG